MTNFVTSSVIVLAVAA